MARMMRGSEAWTWAWEAEAEAAGTVLVIEACTMDSGPDASSANGC